VKGIETQRTIGSLSAAASSDAAVCVIAQYRFEMTVT
jgi:hypothetical protein